MSLTIEHRAHDIADVLHLLADLIAEHPHRLGEHIETVRIVCEGERARAERNYIGHFPTNVTPGYAGIEETT